MKRHIKFLKKSRVEALKSVYQQQIGCVLVSSGRILSTGYNQIRFKGRGNKYTKWSSSLHAERDCLAKVNKDEISNATLYIWRESSTGPALSMPCDQCWYMIEELGFIKKVVYTTNEFPYFKVVKV